MATAAQVRTFRETQANIVRLAELELRAFYATLDTSDALATVRALEMFLPELIRAYGDIGASVAADFYAELRAGSVGGRFSPRLASPVPLEQATISTKWAVGPLFGGTGTEAALSNLLDVTDRLIKQQGRNTIWYNAGRDPAGAKYARVPSGTETCTYCLMLASRGAVYSSEKAADGLHKFHGGCDCAIVPVWTDDDLGTLKNDAGYDADVYYDKWQDALAAEEAAKAAK